MNRALLIVDVQNDYFEGGALPLHKPLEALANIETVLGLFRERNLLVAHVQHINPPDDTFFLPESYGAQIHPHLSPLEHEHHVVKSMPNSFLETGLAEWVKSHGITELVVCGMMSHMCIDTTVRACQDFGLSVIVLDDACATMSLEYGGEIIPAETVHKTFMASLDGIFARVMRTGEFCAAL